jgi:hypothetical protein
MDAHGCCFKFGTSQTKDNYDNFFLVALRNPSNGDVSYHEVTCILANDEDITKQVGLSRHWEKATVAGCQPQTLWASLKVLLGYSEIHW